MGLSQVGSVVTDSNSKAPTPGVALPSVLAGDTAVIFAFQRASATALSATVGGATATVRAHSESTTYGAFAILTYRFPSDAAGPTLVVNGNTGTNLSIGVIAVVLRNVHATTPVEAVGTINQFAAPGSPYDVTAGSVNTSGASWAYAFWGSNDDNTWAKQTAAWTQDSSLDVTSGTDCSLLVAHQIMGSGGGAAGGSVGRETANGGDAGTCVQISIDAAPLTVAVTADSETDTANAITVVRPPSAPTNVDVDHSGNDHYITWTDENHGVGQPTVYDIYRSTDPDTGFVKINSNSIAQGVGYFTDPGPLTIYEQQINYSSFKQDVGHSYRRKTATKLEWDGRAEGIRRVVLRMGRYDSPTDKVRVRLVADNGGLPGSTTLGTSNEVDVTASGGPLEFGDWYNFDFVNSVVVSAQTLWIVAERTGAYDNTHYYVVLGNAVADKYLYYTDENDTWQSLGNRDQARQVQEGFTPTTVYYYKVRATNTLGYADSSPSKHDHIGGTIGQVTETDSVHGMVTVVPLNQVSETDTVDEIKRRAYIAGITETDTANTFTLKRSPLAPTDVVVSNSGSSHVITWTDELHGEAGTYYEVYRSTNPDTGFVKANASDIAQGTETFTDEKILVASQTVVNYTGEYFGSPGTHKYAFYHNWSSGKINRVSFYAKKVSSPTDKLRVRIVNDNSGVPGDTTLATSAEVTVTTFAWYNFDFASEELPTAKIWFILERTGAYDENNHYDHGITIGSNEWYQDSSDTWNYHGGVPGYYIWSVLEPTIVYYYKVRAVNTVGYADSSPSKPDHIGDTIDQVTETDSVTSITRQVPVIQAATETDTAEAISEIKAAQVALVSETDSVFDLVPVKQRTLNILSETDDVYSISGIKQKFINAVSDLETTRSVIKYLPTLEGFAGLSSTFPKLAVQISDILWSKEQTVLDIHVMLSAGSGADTDNLRVYIADILDIDTPIVTSETILSLADIPETATEFTFTFNDAIGPYPSGVYFVFYLTNPDLQQVNLHGEIEGNNPDSYIAIYWGEWDYDFIAIDAWFKVNLDGPDIKGIKQKIFTESTETDSVSDLTYNTTKLIDLEQTSETDDAAVLTVKQGKLVAQVTETDDVTSLVACKRITGSQVTETDSVTVTKPVKYGSVVETTETETAISLIRRIAFGSATETDTVTGLSKVIGLGLVAETDAAETVRYVPVNLVDTATETDSVDAFSSQKIGTLEQATETDSVTDITGYYPTIVDLTLVTETDDVTSFSRPTLVSLEPVSETDIIGSITGKKLIPLTDISETDSVTSLSGLKRKALAQAIEIETPWWINWPRLTPLKLKNTFNGSDGTEITKTNLGLYGDEPNSISWVGHYHTADAIHQSYIDPILLSWHTGTQEVLNDLYLRFYFKRTGSDARYTPFLRLFKRTSSIGTQLQTELRVDDTGRIIVYGGTDRSNHQDSHILTTLSLGQWVRIELAKIGSPDNPQVITKIWLTDLDAADNPDIEYTCTYCEEDPTALFNFGSELYYPYPILLDEFAVSTENWVGPVVNFPSVSETDESYDAVPLKTRIITVTETETAYAIIPKKIGAIQAVEDYEVVSELDALHGIFLATILEDDTAWDIKSSARYVVVAQVQEDSFAVRFTKPVNFAQTLESEIANQIQPQSIRLISSVDETDSAYASTVARRRQLSTISETEVVEFLSRIKTRLLAGTSETDAVTVLVGVKHVAVAKNLETDTAYNWGHRLHLAQVLETDEVYAFSTTTSGMFKVWDGNEWIYAQAYVYWNDTWMPAVVRHWTGVEWALTGK